RGRRATLEGEAAGAAPELSEASEVWYRLSAVRERLRGTATLASERLRLLGTAEETTAPGQDPDDLRAQAERARSAHAELLHEVEIARAAVEAAVGERERAEGLA